MSREPSGSAPLSAETREPAGAAGVLEIRDSLPEAADGSDLAEAAGQESPPAWFRRRQNGNGAQSPPRRRGRRTQPLIVTSGDEERELTLSERIERWLLGAPGVAYLLSMLFHASLLVGFALVVSSMLPSENERGTILIEPQESEEISLDEVDMAVELAPVQVDPLPAQLRQVPVVEAEVPVPLPDDILTELPKVGGEGTGEAGGEGLALPKTANAVTKGSFTAWTIPEDPEPGRSYIIVIEVKLPDKVRSYRVSDLSGLIVGTDQYDQRLPLDHRNPLSTRVIRGGSADVVRTDREHLPITDNRIQLLIEVPGAMKLVKDRINIRSRILKEKQDLEITF